MYQVFHSVTVKWKKYKQGCEQTQAKVVINHSTVLFLIVTAVAWLMITIELIYILKASPIISVKLLRY
jgi:hypothetical protein